MASVESGEMYAMVRKIRKMPSCLFYPFSILTGLFEVAEKLVALYNFIYLNIFH